MKENKMLVNALTIIDALKIKKDVIDDLVSQGVISPVYDDDMPKYELKEVLKHIKQEDKEEKIIKAEKVRKKKLSKIQKDIKNSEKWKKFHKRIEQQTLQGINIESHSRLRLFHGEIVELLKESKVMPVWKIINTKLPDGFQLSYPSFLSYVNRHIKGKK